MPSTYEAAAKAKTWQELVPLMKQQGRKNPEAAAQAAWSTAHGDTKIDVQSPGIWQDIGSAAWRHGTYYNGSEAERKAEYGNDYNGTWRNGFFNPGAFLYPGTYGYAPQSDSHSNVYHPPGSKGAAKKNTSSVGSGYGDDPAADQNVLGYGGVSEYEKSLSPAYEAARNRIKQKYAAAIEGIHKAKNLGLQAIGLLPGKYAGLQKQSEGDLASFGGGVSKAATQVPTFAKVGFDPKLAAEPFNRATQAINASRSDLAKPGGLLDIGQRQYAAGQFTAANMDEGNELADLEAQRADAIAKYAAQYQLNEQVAALGLKGPGSQGVPLDQEGRDAALRELFTSHEGSAYASRLRGNLLAPETQERIEANPLYQDMEKEFLSHKELYMADPSALVSKFGNMPVYLSHLLARYNLPLPDDMRYIQIAYGG